MNKQEAIEQLKRERIIGHELWDGVYVYLDDEQNLRDHDNYILNINNFLTLDKGYHVVNVLNSVEQAPLLKREIKRQIFVIRGLEDEVAALRRRLQDFENWNKHPY